MAILLYYALLAVWPLLLWPALRLTGLSRLWLLIVAIAGLLAIIHEISMYYGTVSAIRLDIPLIAVALGVLYATAAVVMFRGRWRKSAAALVVVLLVSGGGMTYAWTEAGRESVRLTEVFKARNALLFEAKFRSLDAYTAHFQMFDAKPTSLPVGHWQTRGGGYFSQMVINPEGHAWAFYPCGETKCAYQSAETGLQPVGDPAEKRWEVMLTPPVGAPVTVRIAQIDPNHLTVEGQGQPATLTMTPPPIDPAPAHKVLTFLGPFTQMECRSPSAKVRQLWLWQEDTRLYAVGIFSILLAGTDARFVSPILLGEGIAQGNSWSFQWRRNRQSWKALITLEGPDALLTLERNGEQAASAALKQGAIFRDEAIELAPLTSKVDWDRWFDVVLVGHFSSGKIPAC